MAGIALAGLSTAAALGYTAAGFAPEAVLLPATVTAAGLFTGGRWIAKGIKGDLDYHKNKRQKILEELYAKDAGSRTKKRIADRIVQNARVKRKLDMGMDSVVAGNSSVKQRATTKRQLKAGKVGGKLRKLNDNIIYRWQRMYPYGQNTTAYPNSITQESNAQSGGRLQLSHYTTGGDGSLVNHLPVYLWDLTCWKTENIDGTVPTGPGVCRRLFFDSSNQPSWQGVYTQYQTHALVNDSSWQMERSNLEDTNAFPRPQERKALLKWSDIRMCFYGARQHPTRIIVELVQFKDEKYTMDFHADGEPFANLTTDDKDDVRGLWLEEVKKLVYHPLDVQNFQRAKGITSLYRESFQIAPDDTTNADVCPPNVVKRIFKRFNRLVNFDWQTPPVTGTTGIETQKNELETPAFQVGTQSNLKPYADPKARIYLYIRAEDMDPVTATSTLSIPGAGTTSLPNAVQGSTLAGAQATAITDINGTATPAGTFVSGYEWQNYNYTQILVPTFSKLTDTSPQWSTSTTPSFDIMLRQKWVLQQ